MKYLFYLAAFGLMLWALAEQTREHPNIYVQIIAVIVFFFMMMRLMNQTPSNYNKKENEDGTED